MKELTQKQAEIIRQHELGFTAKEIGKRVGWKTSEVIAVISLYAKRPGLEIGFRGMQKLAREAGLK